MPYAKTPEIGVVRDVSTQAIINTNDNEYFRLVEKRKQTKTIQHLQSQVDALKREFSEIKNLINQTITGKT